jgi:hypothetical protein|tara:strand:+ start:809 stop:1006 length:198 start_codon:yes stop_codon:yes gene_type:complete
MIEKYQTPILVPFWSNGKSIGYSIYIVDVQELAAFLPATKAKSTTNMYAGQTFVEGWRAAKEEAA